MAQRIAAKGQFLSVDVVIAGASRIAYVEAHHAS
jgi:hypothetical protein